ncbi:M20 metallopeptidase family protein [Brevibacterium litoralis]|uniref:M20 metallopeptidase family protein n=1 Tax=Brevibacterium litoralis TaxID=3138935 RepID=UPI0032EE3C4A
MTLPTESPNPTVAPTTSSLPAPEAVRTDLQPALVALRRDLHRFPEVGLHLPRTQDRVLREIEHLDGLEITRGEGLSSLVVVLRGGARPATGAQAVLLRGDMDALPVTEGSGFDFASDNGAMHACGHDLHTAGLVGAVHLLHGIKDRLAGDVVFMFQPGEEGHDGAGKMIEEGVLEAAGVPVVAAFGVHVSGDNELGHLYTRPGTWMSAASMMNVTIRGRGAHGTRPHTGRDPVHAGAHMVTGLQEYITRRFDIFDPVVATVGVFEGGTAVNVIPDTARMEVTVRTFSNHTTERVLTELPEFMRNTARTYGLEAEVEFTVGLPATINDEAETAFFLDTFTDLFGSSRVHVMPNPKSGSEDFSKILQRVPGTYGHIGVAPAGEDPAAQPSNHSPLVRHSDDALGDQALFLATLAERRLGIRD